MLKSILKLNGVKKMDKETQSGVNGGNIPFPTSADCRDYHQGNCPSFCRPEECDPNTPCIHT